MPNSPADTNDDTDVVSTVMQMARDRGSSFNIEDLGLGDDLTKQLLRLRDLILSPDTTTGAEGETLSAPDRLRAQKLLDQLRVYTETQLSQGEEGSDALEELREAGDQFLVEIRITTIQAAKSDEAEKVLLRVKSLLQAFVEHEAVRRFVGLAKDNLVELIALNENHRITVMDEAPDKLKKLEEALQEEQVDRFIKDLNVVLFSRSTASPEALEALKNDPFMCKADQWIGAVRSNTESSVRWVHPDIRSSLQASLPLVTRRVSDWSKDLGEARVENKADEYIKSSLDFLTIGREQFLKDQMDALDPEALIALIDESLNSKASRGDLFAQAKQFIMGYLSETIPTLQAPPIEGETEGVTYKVSNLDLSGVLIDPSAVTIRFATLEEITRGEPFMVASVKDITAKINGLSWDFKQSYFPFFQGKGQADADVTGLGITIAFQLMRTTRRQEREAKTAAAASASASGEESEKEAGGDGNDENKNEEDDASIDQDAMQPRFVVCFTEVKIGDINVHVHGHWLSWLANTLSELFAHNIKEYLIAMLQEKMVDYLDAGLDRGNSVILNNWSRLNTIVEIDVDKLPTELEASKVSTALVAKRQTSRRRDLYSVVFEGTGPIGMEFSQSKEAVVVGALTRRDKEILPAERSGKIRVGDVLVSVGGVQVTALPLKRVMLRLRHARRPLELTFQPRDVSASGALEPYSVSFKEPKLYMLIKAPAFDRGAMANGFRPKEDGSPGPAEVQGRINMGDVLVSINGTSTLNWPFKETLQRFATTTARPISLEFVPAPDVQVVFTDERPTDLHLGSFSPYVIVTGFGYIKGPAETQCGDRLEKGFCVQELNGEDGRGWDFAETIERIKSSERPVRLGFGPCAEENEGGEGAVAPVCTASFGEGPLGLIFYKSPKNDVRFKAFSKFPGPAKRSKSIFPGLVLEAVNGTPVGEDAEAAKRLLATADLPITLALRNMETYGWLDKKSKGAIKAPTADVTSVPK